MQTLSIQSIIKDGRKYWIKKTLERTKFTNIFGVEELKDIENYYVGVTKEDVTDSSTVDFRMCDALGAGLFEAKYKDIETKIDFECPECGSSELVHMSHKKALIDVKVFKDVQSVTTALPIGVFVGSVLGCEQCKILFIPQFKIG